MTESTFERFRGRFPPDPEAAGAAQSWSDADTRSLLGSEAALYTDFLTMVARSSHAGGLLRFLLPGGQPSLAGWNDPGGWLAEWPDVNRRLFVIAYDWMGSQIGFDKARRKRGEPLMAILEPGTGELLEIPQTFSEFVSGDLVEQTDAVVAESFYRSWLRGGGGVPSPTQCVGYKVPPFLGGDDEVTNLEMTDLETYVSISGQLWQSAESLPPGTSIADVRLR